MDEELKALIEQLISNQDKMQIQIDAMAHKPETPTQPIVQEVETETVVQPIASPVDTDEAFETFLRNENIII